MNKDLFKKNKRGSALALVLIMVLVVAIILSSLLVYISAEVSFSKDNVERERAFQIAESGIYYYNWYLAHEVEGKTAQQIQTFWQTGNPYGVNSPYVVQINDPEGGAIGEYSLKVTPPITGSTIVTVTSTGWTFNKPSAKRVVQVRFRRPAWSENVVLANDNMRFGAGTTVNGKIFSNLGIRFDGVATNVISSALASYQDPDHTGGPEFGVHTHVNAPPASGTNDNFRPNEAPPNAVPSRPDVFQAGRDFPVPQVDFSSLVADISYMRSSASIKFANTGAGWQIILQTNGTMNVCKVNSYNAYNVSTGIGTNSITNYTGVVSGATGSSASTNGTACTTTACCASGSCAWIQSSNHAKGQCASLTNYPIPNNGIIFVANNAWIEGTINKEKVSIVAAELPDEPNYTGGNKDIFLGNNNLLYTNSDGEDIIGLIAQQDIEVIQNSQNNLTIDGALLAQGGRVGRDNYGTSDVKSTITINGSLATNVRYGFAYVGTNNNCGSGVQIYSGYCFRNLNFDNNLLYYPPPYFPTGTEYSIDLWKELQ